MACCINLKTNVIGDCAVHRTFRCAWCRRIRSWSQCCGDDYVLLCDDCWSVGPQLDLEEAEANRVTRGTCPYCGGPRICSALARAENPYCAACLHERMREAKRDN